MSRRMSLQATLGVAVRVGEVSVGVVADAILSRDLSLVFGFRVRSHAGKNVFLPWSVATVGDDGRVTAETSASLLGESELAYYLEHGIGLRELGGASTDEHAQQVDALVDPLGRIVDASLGRDAVVAQPIRTALVPPGSRTGPEGDREDPVEPIGGRDGRSGSWELATR